MTGCVWTFTAPRIGQVEKVAIACDLRRRAGIRGAGTRCELEIGSSSIHGVSFQAWLFAWKDGSSWQRGSSEARPRAKRTLRERSRENISADGKRDDPEALSMLQFSVHEASHVRSCFCVREITSMLGVGHSRSRLCNLIIPRTRQYFGGKSNHMHQDSRENMGIGSDYCGNMGRWAGKVRPVAPSAFVVAAWRREFRAALGPTCNNTTFRTCGSLFLFKTIAAVQHPHCSVLLTSTGATLPHCHTTTNHSVANDGEPHQERWLFAPQVEIHRS
jgi:hypothetical protein